MAIQRPKCAVQPVGARIPGIQISLSGSAFEPSARDIRSEEELSLEIPGEFSEQNRGRGDTCDSDMRFASLSDKIVCVQRKTLSNRGRMHAE